jgi:cytoskeletal protein CcmA (bactofilin family)
MWDKTKLGPAPQSHPGLPPGGAGGAAAAPARAPEPASKGTAIGSAITIIGDIYSEEDLYIDGEVRGTLEIKDSRVTIGPNAKAESNIKAREVIILGQVQGDIDASQKITIRKAGSLVGNIRTTGIVIDDDAYFKGSIDIVRKQ